MTVSFRWQRGQHATHEKKKPAQGGLNTHTGETRLATSSPCVFRLLSSPAQPVAVSHTIRHWLCRRDDCAVACQPPAVGGIQMKALMASPG